MTKWSCHNGRNGRGYNGSFERRGVTMSGGAAGNARPTFRLICLLASFIVVQAFQPARVGAQAGKPAPQNSWPAFHGGGPLEGVAAPIGPPPMKLRWTYSVEDEEAASTKAATQSSGAAPSFEASAVIVGDTVYAADRGAGLRAIDLRTGKRKWIYRAEDGFSATPAVINGVVYCGDEGGVFHAVR